MDIWNEEVQTGLKEAVLGWIAWARRSLPSAGNIPAIFNTGSIFNPHWRQNPWWETVEQVPWEYCSDFETHYGCCDPCKEGSDQVLPMFQELDLADLPSRFVALSVCYELAHYKPVFLNEDLASQARERHGKNLAQLVRLVPIDLFDDWRRIRWEILNAYVISDWDRALDLYDRAKDLNVRSEEIEALRGQFRFLVALGHQITPSLDSLSWPPEVYPAASVEGSLLLLLGSVPINTETAPAGFDRDWVRHARFDLETAVAKPGGLPPAYRAALARCYFLTDQFSNAAKEYEKLLSEHLDVFGEDHKSVVYRSTATSLQRDGQTEKAREISERWLRDYPDDPEALRLMADVLTRQTKYEKACEYYRRLVDLKPELEEDVATKIALALGGVSPAKLSTLAEDLMKRRPEVTELIKSLNLELWPVYKCLTDPAREKWLDGCCLMYYMPSLEPARKAGLYQSGAYNFALAVELQMKARVFGLFKVEVKKTERLKKAADEGRSKTETKPFCEYLLFPGSGVFTLGSMHWVLKNCGESQQPILREFRQWLCKRNPALLEAIDDLGELVNLRNPVGHDIVNPEEASKAPGLCVKVIEILYEPPDAADAGS